MAKISHLEIERKEQYVVFDDCDSMTDYFHSTRGSLKYIIEIIKKHGGNQIKVNVINNAPDIPALRRINAICKKCGYKAKDTSRPITYNAGCPDEFTVKHLEWILTKNQDVETTKEYCARKEKEDYADDQATLDNPILEPTKCYKLSHGLCVRCNKAPAYIAILKLCDNCFNELNKIPAPQAQDTARAWDEYAAQRRAFLSERL